MLVGTGIHLYEWIDGWAEFPDTPNASAGWAHPGLVVTDDGHVVTAHPGEATLLVFDREGHLERSVPTDLTEIHGITLVNEEGRELLWIVDSGAKRNPKLNYRYESNERKGRVVKITLDGQIIMNLQKPDLSVYRDGAYSPTSVAVSEERYEGNGDIWVADGYGQSYVHRYSKEGRYISSINGEEGDTGRFNCPHGIFIDRRKAEPELYVADRSNSRVQVYDLNGSFKRDFGSYFLSSPSAFASYGDLLLIAELRARLALLDINDELLGYLGDNEEVCSIEGWPNMKEEEGHTTRSNHLNVGKLNSPHGLGVDRGGSIYITEWLIGGRLLKLERLK